MPAPVAKLVPAVRLTSYAITPEGTGPERKYSLIELVTEGDRVTSRKILDKSRWRDLAEDALRRKLRGA